MKVDGGILIHEDSLIVNDPGTKRLQLTHIDEDVCLIDRPVFADDEREKTIGSPCLDRGFMLHASSRVVGRYNRDAQRFHRAPLSSEVKTAATQIIVRGRNIGAGSTAS